MLNKKRTYSDFLEAEEGIATNILIDRLKQLEQDGIVEKVRDPENRRSFLYKLTQKGRDLAPVIVEIILWGGKYDSRPNAKRDVLEKIQADRKAFQLALQQAE